MNVCTLTNLCHITVSTIHVVSICLEYMLLCVCVFMCMDGCVGLLGFMAGFFACGWTKI